MGFYCVVANVLLNSSRSCVVNGLCPNVAKRLAGGVLPRQLGALKSTGTMSPVKSPFLQSSTGVHARSMSSSTSGDKKENASISSTISDKKANASGKPPFSPDSRKWSASALLLLGGVGYMGSSWWSCPNEEFSPRTGSGTREPGFLDRADVPGDGKSSAPQTAKTTDDEKKPRVVVIGGGVIGGSVAYFLARLSKQTHFPLEVVLLDAGYAGSSWGESRIARMAYTDKLLVRLMRFSFQLFKELEGAIGKTILIPVGVLDVYVVSLKHVLKFGTPEDLATGHVKESLSVTAQLRDQRAVYDELGIDYDWCETQAELDTALEKDWDLHKVRLAALKKEALEKGSQDALDDLHTCNLVDKFEPVVKLSEATDRGLFLKAFNAVTGELQGAAVLASVVVNGLMTACEKEGVEVVPETAVEIVPRRHRSFLKASMEKTEEDSPHGRFASGGTVMTNDNENPGIDFDYIVFCAGPWTNKVLGAAGLDGYPLIPTNEQVVHFSQTTDGTPLSETSAYNCPRLPIVIERMSIADDENSVPGETKDTGLYMIARIVLGEHATEGVKAGYHRHGEFLCSRMSSVAKMLRLQSRAKVTDEQNASGTTTSSTGGTTTNQKLPPENPDDTADGNENFPVPDVALKPALLKRTPNIWDIGRVRDFPVYSDARTDDLHVPAYWSVCRVLEAFLPGLNLGEAKIEKILADKKASGQSPLTVDYSDLCRAEVDEVSHQRCLYTEHLGPDEDFVVGPHPGESNVWTACGFAGEGFKFGPVVGFWVAMNVLEKIFRVGRVKDGTGKIMRVTEDEELRKLFQETARCWDPARLKDLMGPVDGS